MTEASQLGMTIKLKPHVKIREEKRGTVIFDTLNEKVYVINETGADILKTLLRGKNLEETITALSAEYQSDAEMVKRDVVEFVNDLLSRSLLERAPGDVR